MKFSRLALTFAAAPVALMGCGGGSAGSPTEDAVVEALDLSQKQSGDELSAIGIGDTEYRCMAKGMLDNAEYKKALEEGIAAQKTGQDLLNVIDTVAGDSAGNEILLLLANCLGEDKLVELFVTMFGADASVTDEMKTCMRDGLTELGKDGILRAFRAVIAEDQASEDFLAIGNIFTTCMGS